MAQLAEVAQGRLQEEDRCQEQLSGLQALGAFLVSPCQQGTREASHQAGRLLPRVSFQLSDACPPGVPCTHQADWLTAPARPPARQDSNAGLGVEGIRLVCRLVAELG